MDKKKKLILLIAVVIFLLVICFNIIYSKAKISNQIIYNEEIPQNVSFIKSNSSKLFDYEMHVKLETNKDKNGYMHVGYLLRVTPKSKIIYKKVQSTVFWDESLRKVFVAIGNGFLGFGNDISQDYINFDENNKGLEIARSTLVSNFYTIEELKKSLVKNIRAKVVWSGGSEYVILTPDNMEFTVVEE